MHIQQFQTVQGFLSSDEVDNVVKLMSAQVDLGTASVLSRQRSWKDRFHRNCKSGWLPHNATNAWLYMRLNSDIQSMNDQTYQFNLDGSLEALQYLEYGPMEFYRRHVDNGHDDVATRKLTAIIQLSDPDDYVGGSTRIWSETTSKGIPLAYAPKGRGDLTLFPSHLPHRANPVIWGRRKVLVAWFRGLSTLT
jgi:PKHD-type hydroxylase